MSHPTTHSDGQDPPPEDIELANGDTLAERVEQVNLETEETVSVDEMRERLGLAE